MQLLGHHSEGFLSSTLVHTIYTCNVSVKDQVLQEESNNKKIEMGKALFSIMRGKRELAPKTCDLE